MRTIFASLILMMLQVVPLSAVSAKDEFPGRVKYPTIPVYELADLKRDLDKVIVVDARSSYEFETLRMKNAINIPVDSSTFAEELGKIRKTSNKPIVFYCNGRTCMKSYKAAVKAGQHGITNTYSFDAGIFEWADLNPDDAQLLGVSPVDRKRLIAKSEFKKRCLPPLEFADKVYAPGAKVSVLDVRDRNQRGGSIGFFPGKERWISLSDKQKIKDHINKAKEKGQTLFIYDQVGKQVRWLQYTLEDLGHTDYYFMKGGSNSYLNITLNQ